METKDENQEKEVLSEEELNKVNGGMSLFGLDSNSTDCGNIKDETTCMNNPNCVWRVVTGFFATLFSWFGSATSYCHDVDI